MFSHWSKVRQSVDPHLRKAPQPCPWEKLDQAPRSTPHTLPTGWLANRARRARQRTNWSLAACRSPLLLRPGRGQQCIEDFHRPAVDESGRRPDGPAASVDGVLLSQSRPSRRPNLPLLTRARRTLNPAGFVTAAGSVLSGDQAIRVC